MGNHDLESQKREMMQEIESIRVELVKKRALVDGLLPRRIVPLGKGYPMNRLKSPRTDHKKRAIQENSISHAEHMSIMEKTKTELEGITARLEFKMRKCLGLFEEEKSRNQRQISRLAEEFDGRLVRLRGEALESISGLRLVLEEKHRQVSTLEQEVGELQEHISLVQMQHEETVIEITHNHTIAVNKLRESRQTTDATLRKVREESALKEQLIVSLEEELAGVRDCLAADHAVEVIALQAEIHEKRSLVKLQHEKIARLRKERMDCQNSAATVRALEAKLLELQMSQNKLKIGHDEHVSRITTCHARDIQMSKEKKESDTFTKTSHLFDMAKSNSEANKDYGFVGNHRRDDSFRVNSTTIAERTACHTIEIQLWKEKKDSDTFTKTSLVFNMSKSNSEANSDHGIVENHRKDDSFRVNSTTIAELLDHIELRARTKRLLPNLDFKNVGEYCVSYKRESGSMILRKRAHMEIFVRLLDNSCCELQEANNIIATTCSAIRSHQEGFQRIDLRANGALADTAMRSVLAFLLNPECGCVHVLSERRYAHESVIGNQQINETGQESEEIGSRQPFMPRKTIAIASRIPYGRRCEDQESQRDPRPRKTIASRSHYGIRCEDQESQRDARTANVALVSTWDHLDEEATCLSQEANGIPHVDIENSLMNRRHEYSQSEQPVQVDQLQLDLSQESELISQHESKVTFDGETSVCIERQGNGAENLQAECAIVETDRRSVQELSIVDHDVDLRAELDERNTTVKKLESKLVEQVMHNLKLSEECDRLIFKEKQVAEEHAKAIYLLKREYEEKVIRDRLANDEKTDDLGLVLDGMDQCHVVPGRQKSAFAEKGKGKGEGLTYHTETQFLLEKLETLNEAVEAKSTQLIEQQTAAREQTKNYEGSLPETLLSARKLESENSSLRLELERTMEELMQATMRIDQANEAVATAEQLATDVKSLEAERLCDREKMIAQETLIAHLEAENIKLQMEKQLVDEDCINKRLSFKLVDPNEPLRSVDSEVRPQELFVSDIQTQLRVVKEDRDEKCHQLEAVVQTQKEMSENLQAMILLASQRDDELNRIQADYERIKEKLEDDNKLLHARLISAGSIIDDLSRSLEQSRTERFKEIGRQKDCLIALKSEIVQLRKANKSMNDSLYEKEQVIVRLRRQSTRLESDPKLRLDGSTDFEQELHDDHAELNDVDEQGENTKPSGLSASESRSHRQVVSTWQLDTQRSKSLGDSRQSTSLESDSKPRLDGSTDLEQELHDDHAELNDVDEPDENTKPSELSDSRSHRQVVSTGQLDKWSKSSGDSEFARVKRKLGESYAAQLLVASKPA